MNTLRCHSLWCRSAFAVMALCLLSANTRAEREVVSNLDCVVEPSAVVDLGAAVPGLLADTRYAVSDIVEAGSVMARLESGVEEVALALAEEIAASHTAIELRAATHDFGTRTLARNERLTGDDAVSRQALDQVRTEAAIAALQLKQERESQVLARLEAARARAQLERRLIRTPIAGHVIQQLHEAGEYVDAEPVYRVAQLDPLYVEVIVPIDYLGTLERGMSAGVTLSLPGFEGRPLSATVQHIDAVADAASASYGVRLELPNPDNEIPSGVRCEIDFYAS